MKKKKRVCNISPEAHRLWSSLMLSAESRFSSSTSNSKLRMLEQDSQQRWWHPLFRTGSGAHYRKISRATQPSQPPQMAQVSAGVSECHWFPGKPTMQRVGHRTSAQCLFSNSPDDTMAALVPGIKKKVLYRTGQKSSKNYTTQLGSQTQIQKGFRKQRGSEKSHIKTQGTGKQHWDWPSEEHDLLFLQEKAGSLCITTKLQKTK